MPFRRITSRDVALIPQPGFNLAESIHFSPDENFLTYIRSSHQTLIRRLHGFDLRTDREFIYTDRIDPNEPLTREEQFQREVGVFLRQRLLITSISRYQWTKNKSQSVMLIPIGNDLFIHDRKGFRLLVHGSHLKPIADPKLSPDGSFVAYVQDCELYCISTIESIPIAQPRQLTFDARGFPNKTNGLAEFIAQEEMDRNDGFWWSDDSSFLAFTQVDESNVPVYRIPHSGSDEPEQTEEHRYPFTGKDNVKVSVGVIDLNSKDQPDIHWVDLSAFDDYYVARVGFFPDQTLALQIENRQQTNLKLLQYDFLRNQPMKLLVEERSDTWINLHDLFYPLKKIPGAFLWANERTGFMHLELRNSNDEQSVKRLTNGNWVVQQLVDVDENNSIVYFLGNRETPVDIHLYAVNYEDEKSVVERITEESGCHSVYCFNRTYQYCITQWNSIDQYPLIRMLDVRTRTVVKIFEHLQQKSSQITEQFHFVKPKIYSMLNRNKDILYCALYKPDDQQGRYQTPYPTLVSVYGGPHLQRVVNSWSLRTDMRCQRLVESGYVVLRLDNRGSLNRGVAFESAIRHDMGHLEIEDQIDGVRQLIEQGISDPTRIGIYGWSYGGYLSAMALVRGGDVFKLGIAGAPVTHWDGYDTHYTERYMGTPDDNPHGYEMSSVMYHIENLKGHLMIIHGLIDENVHFRHSARLINALIKANKPYELVLFPDERHMPRKWDERIYMEERIFEFIRKYL